MQLSESSSTITLFGVSSTKNFSLIHQSIIGSVFSPAYDLVATALVNPADEEDMALTLNGKKKKIKKSDFIAAFNNVKLDAKQQENIFKKIVNAKSKWFDFIDSSFLSEDYKAAYKILINRQIAKVV